MSYMPRIAVIDDQPELADLFRLQIGDEYDIVGFSDTQEAVEALRHGDFDLVFLDILMPQRSGLELLREIKESSDVPVIMMTMAKERETIIAALRLGADDYLEKPFDFDVVRQRIDAGLRKRTVELPPDGSLPRLVLLAPDITLDVTAADQRVRMVLAIVEKDFAAAITLHHLSKVLNLAPYYLGRLIKQETGYSFKDILARYRMRKAGETLVRTQARVKDVARANGFVNFHYFCRMFNRVYGTPASRYRRLGA